MHDHTFDNKLKFYFQDSKSDPFTGPPRDHQRDGMGQSTIWRSCPT